MLKFYLHVANLFKICGQQNVYFDYRCEVCICLWQLLFFLSASLKQEMYVYISFRSNDFLTSCGPWTLKFGQIFRCPTPLFFTMLGDIDLIFGIWVYMYNDELQIKFTFRSGSMIFGRVGRKSWGPPITLVMPVPMSAKHFWMMCLLF
jgi:hypothetical protein